MDLVLDDHCIAVQHAMSLGGGRRRRGAGGGGGGGGGPGGGTGAIQAMFVRALCCEAGAGAAPRLMLREGWQSAGCGGGPQGCRLGSNQSNHLVQKHKPSLRVAVSPDSSDSSDSLLLQGNYSHVKFVNPTAP
jgi:hypothetical protein